MRWPFRLLIVFGLILAGLGLSAFANWQGWLTRATDQATLAGRLEPYMQIHVPEGAGPFPTVLQFHGCGTARANQDIWGAFLAEHGYAVIIVDSLAPRGIGREEALATVCTGFRLTSLERAGDILAALDYARELPFVDTDNLFLAGWSHGGWSIMDLLSLDLTRERPPNLIAAAPGDLDGVRGAILIYPYCGFPSRSLAKGWQTPLPSLMLMGERDSIAPARQCLAVADRLAEDGVSIRHVVYEGAAHDFDVTIHERFHRDRYDEGATLAAREQVLRFLESHSSP